MQMNNKQEIISHKNVMIIPPKQRKDHHLSLPYNPNFTSRSLSNSSNQYVEWHDRVLLKNLKELNKKDIKDKLKLLTTNQVFPARTIFLNPLMKMQIKNQKQVRKIKHQSNPSITTHINDFTKNIYQDLQKWKKKPYSPFNGLINRSHLRQNKIRFKNSSESKVNNALNTNQSNNNDKKLHQIKKKQKNTYQQIKWSEKNQDMNLDHYKRKVLKIEDQISSFRQFNISPWQQSDQLYF